MLKGLVTWFLNNYLGKYLENLNADQLSIALLQGEVELENIPLRKDALRFVDPSLEVVNGVVGRVKLKIPVSRLRSEPWSILMEKVYVVIAPQKHDDYNELQDDALLQEIKMSALDGIESDWRAKHDTEHASSYTSSYTSWMSFGTSLIGTIVDNLQVEICDVHLRYEDAFSIPSKVMACGLSLSLSAQSCDANWTPKFVQREAGDMMAFKLIELQNMSVYVNSKTESFQSLTHEDLLRKMSTSNRAAFQANEYIIHPVCANALMKRNCASKPLNSRKSPRIACEIELGSIEVDIKDVQYQSCVVAGRTLHQLHKNRKFWKWRPHDPVKGNVKAWWQYAITCHMEEIHGNNLNHTWDTVLSKARENVAYVEAFKRHLQNPVVLDQIDRDVKEGLDSSRPYEELKILREQAVILLEKEMAPTTGSTLKATKTKAEEHEGSLDAAGRSETVGQSVLQGWFPMWWGWYDYAQAEDSNNTADAIHSSYTEKNESLLEDELLGALADEANNVVPYKDVVFLSSTVCLNKSLVKLFRSASMGDDDDTKDRLLFELECSQAKLEFEHRPRTMSNKISLSLEAIYARDHVTPDTVFPLLISPQSAQGAPLFPKKTSGPGFGLSHLAKTFQSYMGSSSSASAAASSGGSRSQSNPPIFYLLYEKKPFGSSSAMSKTDYRLHIKSQPLNIVYNPAVMNFLQDFFKIPEGLNRTAQLSQKIRDAALHRMEEVKAKTKEEFRKNLSKLLLDDSNRTLWKKSWDLMLDLSAPQIIIPEHFVDKEALLLVVDLGKLHLDNSVQKSKASSSSCNQDRKPPPPPTTQQLFPYFATSTTMTSGASGEETDSEDEEFVTPDSSPNTPIKSDEGEEDTSAFAANKSIASAEEDTIKFKMYETFSVNMTNMQVIIGRMKDNWRNAHIKGASSLHILDKFSIALQLQRRTVPTDDIDMPKFALSGTLPKLSMHINESKIHAVNRMAQLLLHSDEIPDEEEEEVEKEAKVNNGRCVSTQTPTLGGNPTLSISNEYTEPIFDSTQFKNEASMLILVYFCINDLSIELQSLEKSIVELQLQGVKASLTRRTEETNLGLSVHSLLLVDAIQTLGPNFELLVASHKNVSVDSISGSLRGSDPVSPCSPVSPNPAAAAATGSAEKITNPAEIAKALSALQRNKSNSQIGGGGGPALSSSAAHSMSAMSQFAIDAVDPDALISIDVTLFNSTLNSAEMMSSEAMQIISIQFNSLDVIANQETIIELLSFAKRVMPPELSAQEESMGCRLGRKFPTKDQIIQTELSSEILASALMEDVEEEEISESCSGSSKINNRMHRTEVTADFQRLNVLLLRAVTGRMIGTALLTEARVYAELSDESVIASGSLGGLQVNSLLPGSQLHQRIVSVGKDPAAEEIKKARASVHSELYHQFGMKSSNLDKEIDDVQAFSFKIGYKSIDVDQSRQHAIDLEVKMASVCYLHSTPFIRELKSCATDFLHFLQQLASTIKMAATDLALGIVQRRTESLSRQVDMNDIYWSPLKYGSLKRSSHKRQVPVAKNLFSSSDDKISGGGGGTPAPAPTPHAKGQHAKQSIAGEVEVSIDIHLETPIVVLPRDERSNQVLVGHLGLITIKNEAEHTESNGNRIDRVLVKVEKMNVQCLDLMRQIKSHFHKSSLDIDNLELMSMAKSLTAIELYSDSAQAAGEPILHNTEVAINIERLDLPAASSMMESASYQSFTGDYYDADDLGLSEGPNAPKSRGQQHSFNVHGQVINPLKISLHRGQYCQILETLSTLGKKDTDKDHHQPFNDQVHKAKEEEEGAKDVPVSGSFLVPMLQLELCSESVGTASSKGQALVSVRLEDFAVRYDNSETDESTTEVTLGSVMAEDLSMPSDSPHRILATSIDWQNSDAQNRGGPSWKASSSGLSTSCPRLAASASTVHLEDYFSNSLNQRQRSDSLPEKLNKTSGKDGRKAAEQRNEGLGIGGGQVPLTPPPSLCGSGKVSPTESGTPIAAATTTAPNFSQRQQREGNLVLVKIVNIISEDSLDFEGIHRYVDIDFNTLDIVFSLQSWVIILDFFGIGSPSGSSSEPVGNSRSNRSGSKDHHHQSNLAPASSSSSKPVKQDKHFNSDIKIKVRSLSVLLNHSDYEVARASVNSYVSRLSLHQGNFSLQGSLRKFLVTDLTKDGELYRDRFLSMQGQEKVLTFNFFKYGLGLDDIESSREKQEYDASLKLRMASIIYVHTQRFYSELLAFFNHFHQHQNVMNRIRVAALGESVNETASRGMRLKLDIEAGSPLLLLPLSSKSPRMLVVHLGFLRVFNIFKMAGEEGTISAQTLRSALSNHLLVSRQRRRRRSSSRSSRSTVRSISRRRSGGLKSPGEAGSMGSSSRRRRRLSQHLGVTSNSEEENEDGVPDLPQAQESKCLLDVMSISLSSMDLRTADRLSVFTENLQKEDIVVGGFIVRQNADFKVLLQEKCELQLQVERNLDKAFNHQVPDLSLNGSLSRVHATVDEKQYALIRGLLAHNLGENLDDLAQFLLVSVPTNEYQDPSMQTLLSGLARTCLYLNLELKDVILDLHQHDDDEKDQKLLARVSFVHSVLTYESFSDSSRDVDLVSREILLNDVRYTDLPMNKRPSVFPHILQPLITDKQSWQQKSNQAQSSPLQAEVHFRLSPDTHRITVLVNNMRLMGIFDWWFQVLDFISTNESPPTSQSMQPSDGEVGSKSVLTGETGEEDRPWPNNREFKSSEEPLYPSAGIISRRAPQVVESQGPVFELKLNITDCDFIIIADPSRSDSTAIILRSTTVLAYRPDMVDRPFSCNLNNAEVFSCTLGKENETALSIIDPVTINFEIAGRNVPGMPLKGLSDFLVLEQNKDAYNQLGTYERTAEIQLQQLNVRLSHNDWVVFHKILNSFPHQASNAAAAIGNSSKSSGAISSKINHPTNIDHQLLGKLMDLGFPSSSCQEALTVCDGHLDEAALWLTQHSQPITSGDNADAFRALTAPSSPKYFFEGTNVSFTSFECKISQINICIIDDCRDADVPLVDFSLQRIHFRHDFEQIGQASSVLSSSYYNRALSAWEPLMEPWKCSVGWKLIPIGQVDAKGQKLVCTFEAEDPVHFNVTSTLLDLYHQTKKDWTGGEEMQLALHSQIRGSTRLSKRMPFVPFAIRNETGLRLWFCTQTKTRYRSSALRTASSSSTSTACHDDPEKENWQEVEDGGEIQFSFESKRNKKTSCSTNEISAHQIIVRVEGWEEVSPVSIDKVGTFFRNAAGQQSLPPVRVVFDVSIKDTALKLVTVRSALLVENKLEFDVQLRLENTTLHPKDVQQMTLHPGQRKCVALKHVWAKMVVRPQTSASKTDQWKFSDKSIEWYHILSASENELKCHTCPHLWRPTEIPPQQFCVAVRRLNYPSDPMAAEGERGSGRKSSSHRTWIQPAHVITFLPPVVIINLLPCHLNFRLKSELASMVVAPGKESFVLVNLEEEMIFEFFLDNFPGRGEISLPAGTCGGRFNNFVCRLEVRDYGHRPLDLIGRVEASYGGAVRISIFARHWLVNKTGLPLIFRQEGTAVDAAGQEEENELARLAAPLMFSFADETMSESMSSTHLTMRVGSGLHAEDTPQWCRSFPLQPGSRVRKLFVHPKDSGRVSRIYIIGVDVRVGKGRYRETLIITFSPRFQVHNQTSYKMQMSQRCFATTFTDLEAQASHLQAYPASCLAFHWPRLDRDQLLCLRLMDINGDKLSSLWSGGIVIDKVDSFHLAVRAGYTGDFSMQRCPIFVRVEVSLVGATFVTILTDAANFPPPFRIDNFSQVSLACHQSGVTDENLKTVIKAHQSVPYAWDEPSLPPHITCIAPGGSNASYNLNVIGEGSPLTYENFIFIQMTMESGLVFDVEGTRVYLAPKEAGKRSQLWRMTSGGMLQHEGSSPPQDPKFSSHNHEIWPGKSLVLDIAGPAVQPHTYVPLMLRKPEERRQLTQKWRFTEDGRLMCAHRGLYVQAKDGFCGLKKDFQRRTMASYSWQTWNDLVLGPTQPVTLERTSNSDVPIEQAITRQRMRPGSGNLSIRVSTDGPTRVLQVVDINKTGRPYAKWDDRQWTLINEKPKPQVITDPDEQLHEQQQLDRNRAGVYETQVLFTAKKGIGLSLICHEPSEEILLAYMSNVVIDYQDTAEHSSLDGSIGNIQIDNQLWDAQYPVILFVSPATRSDEYRHMPAITFTVDRMKTHEDDNCKDAEIFKHLMVQIKNVTLNLEEELLCKVFKFAGITRSDEEMERLDENAHETVQNALLVNANAPTAKRFYFGTLKLALNQVKLSVSKSLKLSRDLVAVKTKLGLSLIAFEDALIDLDPFIRVHPFETMDFLTNAVVKHYTDELLSQAVLILGATDFLGNPIGFFNDITEGVSGLVSEGDVGGLIKNVAHGAANSAAKVTGSLSYGISKATVYDKYNEKRLMLRRCVGGTKPRGNADRSKEYLVDGLKGLGFGVFQGLTSIVTETYEGVASDGFSGLFSGLTWGLIGTVSKPALGVLDLATGAATAVKESSRSRRQELPAKIRPSRLVIGLGGVLPIYHRQEALGQELLYRLNGHDINEIYIGHEQLRTGPEEHLQLLISSARILVFARLVVPSSSVSSQPLESSTKNRIMMNVSHAELVCAQSVKTGGTGLTGELDTEERSQTKFYVELVGKFEEDSMETHKRPRVRCDTQILSQQVAQKINLAIDMFEEMTQAVIDNEEQLKQPE